MTEERKLSLPDADAFKSLLLNKVFWLAIAIIVLLILARDSVGGVVFLMLAAVLYFFPAIVARDKHNASSVFVINLFFGWTLIGWVIALAMAVSDPPKQEVVVTAIPMSVERPAVLVAERTCPYCAEDIKAAAVVCKHCGRDLAPLDDPEDGPGGA